ncbi:aminomethyl-transferring glycine dehydrogenase subunit GcvPA [Aminicella lysinilytica]|uniref:Probable glycine dehydrogenase (decarboxylating) subunit 1 n=1 Tax=Aminicella lysinilytica TaxID=433323 RepID=A0A4R6Q2Q6_9FIRM|nr:aminomethyl-transferring glycine dehydrogenase subunit GcvPA [Aminicella lysinilytica]TDP54926.1 glycine dehydrogenase (decarboxylating) alpha subunit [Aminicella lysinilytica]
MGSFVPNTDREQEEMLKEAGYKSFDDMFSCIPDEVRLKRPLNLPSGLSEMEAIREMEEISEKNVTFKHIFRGAGAYNHYIPAIVKSVTAKEEFVTTYTPYQAEISQGVLQSIFEYQTMMCELTGMDVANASHYDGATAAAESIPMCKDRKHKVAYVSSTVHPGTIQVMETYCFGSNTKLVQVPSKDGVTDMDKLAKMLKDDPEAACLVMQQPNFYGIYEDATKLGEIVHEAGAKFVMSVNPIALSVMKTPAECGADVAVGDGQPLGMPIAYGGPYLGFMAAPKSMMRKLPGRIVGETTDDKGNRAYVLTLQAREQHIRREKASSNICSNQALCALTASVYMAAMGADGMKEAATQSTSKAHYLMDALKKAGLKPMFSGEFFNEFITDCPCGSDKLLDALAEKGILGGLPLTENVVLWCTTEMNTKEEMDQVASIVAALISGKEA